MSTLPLARKLIKGKLDTAGQIVVLTALRDDVLKYVKDAEFDMREPCGTPCCVGGHGERSGVLYNDWEFDATDQQWLTYDEWDHIFSQSIPSDPGHVAMLITDLIEYRKTL